MRAKNLAQQELSRLLKSNLSISAGFLFTELFGLCCFMIKFHPETIDYQKKLLRVNLKRLSLTRQDCINIEKIINFTVKHPAQAVLLSNCSQTIKDMLQPTKKDIEAINKMVL